jgi:hypothetical protein
MPLLSLVVALMSSAAPAFPEPLTRPMLAKVERFRWPAPKVFDSAWTKSSQDARGHTLLQLELEGVGHAHWYLATPVTGEKPGVQLDCLVGERDSLFAPSILGESFEAKRWDKPVNVKVLQRLEEQVSGPALIAWTYATTLLAANGPLYVAEPNRYQDDPLSELVNGFLDQDAKKQAARIEAWAEKSRGNNALFESFRAYLPMGTCSMDTTPQRTARVFAELAFARGDLGRFLQLQVRIMGDQFQRTAWSSYGEASHDTESERLLRTGIDLDQFLLGLGVARPERSEGLGSWRLARAINEAGRKDALLPKFEALATDKSLDAYNRLRATQTWFFLQVREDRSPGKASKEAAQKSRDEVKARALALDLHPLAVAWLEM